MAVVLSTLLLLGAVAPVAGTANVGPNPVASTASSSSNDVSTGPDTDKATAEHPSRFASDSNATSVTLITGQTVSVVERDGRKRYSVDADVPMHRVSTQRGTYVFPANVDFQRFDRRLFNVDFLLQQNFTDEKTGSIPVIVSERRRTPDVIDELDVLDSAPSVRRTRTLETIDAVAGRVDKDAASEAYAELAERDDIERVTLDAKYRVSLDEVGNITNARTARRQYNVSGENVTVAVLDTGIDDSHPDLDDAVIREKDFTDENTTADLAGHGTHVAGIIAGDGTASNGSYVGMAPNASLMNVRVLTSDGWGYTSWIVDGMEYATNHSADAISMSLGGHASDARANDPYLDAVEYAIENNVTVVASAGNAGSDYHTIGSPAIHKDVITVGATEKDSDIATFSSRGPTPVGLHLKPNLVAPGVAVTSAASSEAGYSSEYVTYSGTSMSAPAVSGIAALVMEAHPKWTPQRIKSSLVTTADSVGPQDVYTQGSGVVNATDAVRSDVLVTPGTVDFGAYTNNTTASRRVTVTNLGSQNKTLNVSENVTNVLGTGPGQATVNQSQLSLAPGETETLNLTVYTNVSNGIYSGRLSLDGEYTAIFGYVRADRVTVEKHGIDNTSAADDYAFLVTNNTTKTYSSRLFGFEQLSNGTTEYRVIREGAYNLLSLGSDERTDQLIGMSQSITVTENRTVALDENDTAEFALNTSAITAKHGPLLNRSVEINFGKRLSSGEQYIWVSSAQFANSTTARFSADPRLNVSVERVLVPKAYIAENRSAPQFDSPAVYHLLQTSVGVSGSETKTVNTSRLAERRMTYYRTAADETYNVSLHSWTVDPWDDQSDFKTTDGIGDRRRQTVYVTPNRAWYSESASSPSEWSLDTGWGPTHDPGETELQNVNRHPYTGALYWNFDNESTDDVSVVGIPQSDQSNHDFADSTNDTLTLRFNGTVVERQNETDGWMYAFEELNASTDVELEVVGRNGATPLSTKTVTTYNTTYIPEADNRPPYVSKTDVEQLGLNGTGPNGTLVVRVSIWDFDGNVSNVTALAATGDVDTVPFTDTGLDSANWTVGSVRKLNSYSYEARIDVGNYTGPVHLATRARDDNGNTVERTTFDAYRARERPPLARFDANPDPANISRSVTLNGSVSIDNWGIDQYEWTFEDGTTATGEVVNRTYSEFGYHTVELIVTDTNGASDTITREIRVWDRYPPNASVAANATTAEVNVTTVGFDASESTDNYAIDHYEWDFDGDGSADTSTTNATASHTYAELGTYNATVHVVDENGTVGTASVAIEVQDTTPPNASFTANKTTVNASRPLFVNASASTDNSGSVVTYNWTFGDTETAFGETTTHEYDEPGTYVIELFVEDGHGNNDTANVTVEVVDEIPPNARVSTNKTAASLNESVGFDANESTDNHQIDHYEWDFDGDGTVDEQTTSPNASHAYVDPGNYTATVTVVDPTGYTNETTIDTVTVEDTTRPNATVSANVTTTEVYDTVGFDASASTDNYAIDHYEWDFDADGTVDATTTSATASRTYAELGTYNATVHVVDEGENVDSASVTVEVQDTTSPTAVVDANQTVVEISESVAFDANDSTDNYHISSYEWDFDNDSTVDATGQSVVHAFAEKGEYDTVLTTTDEGGNVDTDNVTIIVGNFAPEADAGSNQTVYEGDRVTLNGTNSSDYDQDALSYEWQQIDGKNVKLQDPKTATPEFDAPKTNKPTDLVFELTVTDDDGATDTDTVTVTVKSK